MEGYKFEVVKPEGTYRITIEAAESNKEHRDGEWVNVVRPLVSIASGEHWYPAESREFIRYRGRGYAFDFTMYRTEAFTSMKTGRVIYWGVNGYSRGWTNENGGEVDWKSPARGKLEAMRDAVLDEWAAEHPEWVRLSERRRIEVDLSSAQSEVSELGRKLREAEAHEAALQSRLASFQV